MNCKVNVEKIWRKVCAISWGENATTYPKRSREPWKNVYNSAREEAVKLI